ncbi:MAG: PKD domain-containing protein, partial [Thermoplasmata archaeon]|nr:PKD domain-containing protein [Thermoplasmata archaeon]
TAISQNITLPPNVRFYLAGFVNVSNVTNDKGAHLMIRAYDAGDNLLQIFNGTTRRRGTAANFQSLGQLRYEPVPNAVKITVSGVLSKSTGTALFDNIRLFEIKPHNTWVPGAIAETFVSTGGRSFKITTTYGQSLVADLIREGVSGVKGYVYEPYLTAIAHPDILFDRYTLGYNLAESYWYASQLYGWMGTVIGDPKIQPYHDLLPDAEIIADDITFSNPKPNSDEDLEIYAKVWNLGNFSLNSLKVRFYLGDPSNDKLIGEKDIAALPILQSTIVNITWNTASNTQNQTIYVVVDPDGIIHEQNEKNNVASKLIYINIKPEILNKDYSTLEINRTESVEIVIDAYDFESAEADLEIFGYCKIKEATEWINISSSAVYNISHWELAFTPEIFADLGRYTFKFHIIDENNCSSLIYFDHAILTVKNNLPEIVEIGMVVNKTRGAVPPPPPYFYYRTEQITAYVDCNDIEVIDAANASNMELEIRYKSLSSGWQQIFDVINFTGLDNNAFRWEIRFTLDEDAELGVYGLSARVRDLDDEYSNWFYKNSSFRIKNNLPVVTNLSLDKTSIFRSESAVITFQTTDIEDLDFNLNCRVEYQLLNYSDPDNLDEALWADELIEGLNYDSFQIGWTANFVTAYDTEVGEYIFRVLAIDKDSSGSGWLVSYNHTLVVNNNPPVADIGTIPSEVDEDEVIGFDARDSYDPERGAYGLSYHWDFGDGTSSTTPKTEYAYSEQGTYIITLVVWDEDGALTEINTTITVLNVGPTATASVDKTIAYANETLSFDTTGTLDTASDFANLSYRWEFGDGWVEQGPEYNQTNHSYSASGVYYIYLTVFDDDGANDTFQLKVRINAIEDLDGDGIPDAIDPDIDGDGIPNEEDYDPYDGTISQQEDKSEEDLTSTYIVAGIILIVVCFIIIWLLFVRSNASKRKERPPRPSAAADTETPPPEGVPATLHAPADELPIPPPPPPEESIQEPPTPYPLESPQLAPQPAVIGYLPAPSEQPEDEMEE